MGNNLAVDPICVGVIGAGDISTVYLNTIRRTEALQLRGIASRSMTSAQEKAAQYGVPAATLDTLLGDPTVELLVNLTPGSEHDAINARIIEAGKHLYTEKPFSLSAANARRLAGDAQAAGLRIGSAPDTFFGAGHQAARRVIDSGGIGKPVLGISIVGHAGVENFHPNPAGFYQSGGEPPFDIGPYYITQWVNLLGPVRHVQASSAKGENERTVLRGPNAGSRFSVEIDTSYTAVLTFDEATVSFVMSLDMAQPPTYQNLCYGTGGSLALVDPNFFGGEPSLRQSGRDTQSVSIDDLPFGMPNRKNHAGAPAADYRGVGLLDLAIGLRTGRRHRADAAFVVHVCEVMEAVVMSARTHETVTIESACHRPAPLDQDRDALLIAAMRSPWP
jgi:predicted dehydrogenase